MTAPGPTTSPIGTRSPSYTRGTSMAASGRTSTPPIGTKSTSKELLNIWRRDICCVEGLPQSVCSPATLASSEWFGQFGCVVEVSVHRNENYTRADRMRVHVRFAREASAARAVREMHQRPLDSRRVLEAELVERCEMKSRENELFAELELEAERAVRPVREQQQQAEQLHLLGRDFRSWQWAEVWEWMMSLQSGKLRRYAVVLGVSLERERVQGTQLKELCIAELHALGVVDSADQQMLLHEIWALQSPLDYWTTS